MSLKRHAFRNKLMEIIEEMAPIFKNRKKFGENVQARFLTINDLQIGTFDSFETYTEVIATISLATDLGSWDQDLLIRSFSDAQLFQEELDRFTALEDRCSNLPNISPTPLINMDREKFRIIYDLGDENPLFQMKGKALELDMNVGRMIAALQGSVTANLRQTGLREFMELIIGYIPVADDEKEKIQMLLEPHYPIIDNTDGGYEPVTLFDPEKIKIHLHGNNQYDFIIPLIRPDANIIDRMTDIAVYFTERAYDEFKRQGNVEQTQKDVQEFFAGYNNVLAHTSEKNLSLLYPNGITLDLQMLISFFLYEMKESADPFTSPDSLRYLYFLLLNKPFLLY
ncbi:MAG: hypothetical protein GPJ54_14925 [Candidatus Heimdallarchaeota archaeon]|nr:hypothetical protein [Candidatus Heimdallarchaeota archaeon]